MNIKDKILEIPAVYSGWAAMFDPVKIKGVQALMPELSAKRVLDVGCGPANNTRLFQGCDYLGIDNNPDYIAKCRQLFPQQRFEIQDINELNLPKQGFDIVLINSILHHLPDELIKRLFFQLNDLIKDGGCVILSEPLKPPPREWLKWLLMNLDRGKFFRSYQEYSALFDSFFEVEEDLRYPLKLLGKTGWYMVVMRLVKVGK
ncbi:MAG: class I SAM-dependent methyltransferase [Candidatus Omnitrophica bacterium]|nr:class I SAM-dependent methyltransferase [Candidatus Omnitrophota bacterium]